MKTEDYIEALMVNLNDSIKDIRNDIRDINIKIDKIQSEVIPEIKIQNASISTKQKGLFAGLSAAISIVVTFLTRILTGS